MNEYVKYIANSIYNALGYNDELYKGAQNKLPFTKRIGLDNKKTNFFEHTVTDYAASIKLDLDNGFDI